VIQAAAELSALGADLYKAEVPALGASKHAAIQEAAGRLTAAIPCPWVVLSNGTPAARFDGAMLAACRGGAGGFLAGRAIWSASLAASDLAAHLGAVAAPRLAALGPAVDAAVTAQSKP
jgi:sulfofructosephosphate aldolase